MKDEYIAFYISSHGFGHLTRSLAIIEHILINTTYHIYICSDTKQIGFAKVYLKDFHKRVIYSIQKTDVGLINKTNSLEVDIKLTELEVRKLLKDYQRITTLEMENLSKYLVKLIVSDISALAFLIGERTNIKAIGIGNFIWVDQYIGIGLSSDILEELKQLYSKGTYFIKYDMSLNYVGIPQTLVMESEYLISRPIEKQRVEDIKKECKIHYFNKINHDKEPEILYISLGMSAELPPIVIRNFEGVVIYTEGVNFKLDDWNHENIVFKKLPLDIKDSQSYIAASSLVIAKAGWSTISESLVAHSRLVLIERPGIDDDMNTINSLKDRNLAISITEDNLIQLDYAFIKAKVDKEIDIVKLNEIQNNTKCVCDKICEFID